MSMSFFASIALTYGAVCLTWLVADRAFVDHWPVEELPESDNKWLDLAMIGVAAVGTFGLGELYRRNYLLPDFAGASQFVSTAINLSIPFLPLFLVLGWRRQSLRTVMLSKQGLGMKLAVGVLAAIVGTSVFLGTSGELARTGEIVRECCSLHSLSHAPAVFLEGVALAFVYERLRWVAGGAVSIWLPCLFFAAAHVPRSLAAGRTPAEVVLWFAFNTILPALILTIVVRSRDVIWIAIPHYVLDVAIGAFH